MPQVVKQTVSIMILTLIVTPVMVAMLLGIGSTVLANSEVGIKLATAFEELNENVKALKLSTQDTATATMENHLIILRTVMKNEKEDNVFRAKTEQRLDTMEKYQNRNYGFLQGIKNNGR